MIKERPPSPKKRNKSSPIKKCLVTNSSTSPSLPFTPPPTQNRNYQYGATSVDNLPSNAPVPSQQYPVYGQNYPPNVPDNSLSIYPQSYLVYSPFNVPVQYDNRIVSITVYYKPINKLFIYRQFNNLIKKQKLSHSFISAGISDSRCNYLLYARKWTSHCNCLSTSATVLESTYYSSLSKYTVNPTEIQCSHAWTTR